MSLLLQSQLYSSYKRNTSLKGLVGITPYGAVSFVSSLYTGAISVNKSVGVVVFWICLRMEIQSWQTKVLMLKISY